MRYFEPVGSADPNAPYVDESSGQEGSAVPAKAIEFPQREIMTVIVGAGLTPDENSVSQLEEAIDLKIATATGGGSSPVDDLLLLLRARNPAFPEVNTADGTFSLTVVSAGNLQIPAGISITHRGCFNDVTSLQSLTTLANKTYHLRKNWTTGWALKDVADSGYNPGALAETDPAFDTGYDDMITHKVVTNGSNVATITPLVNKNRILKEVSNSGAMTTNNGLDDASRTATLEWNLARTPVMAVTPAAIVVLGSGGNFMTGSQTHDHDFNITRLTFSRYGATLTLRRDYAQSFDILATLTA